MGHDNKLKIRCKAITVNHNVLYFVDCRFNIFGSINISSKEITIIDSIPDIKAVADNVITKLLSWGDNFVFVMLNEAKIWLYNVLNCKWEKIVLNDSITECALMDAIIYEDKLYVTGLNDKRVFCVDLLHKTWHVIYTAPYAPFWAFVMTCKDNYLYIPYLMQAGILKINMIDNTCIELGCPDINTGLYGMVCDGHDFAIITNNSGSKNELGFWSEKEGFKLLNKYSKSTEMGMVAYNGNFVIVGYGEQDGINKTIFNSKSVDEIVDKKGYMSAYSDQNYVVFSKYDGEIVIIDKYSEIETRICIEIDNNDLINYFKKHFFEYKELHGNFSEKSMDLSEYIGLICER